MISFYAAYNWLNQFDQSYLSSATRAIASQLSDNFRPFRRENVARWIQRLTTVSTSFGVDEEMAEAYVVCAFAAYRMNQLVEAINYLKAAEMLYASRQHQRAVVKWLLGSVYWARSSDEDAAHALILYQESIDLFERLLFLCGLDMDRRSFWYRRCLNEMRDTLMERARSLNLRAGGVSQPAPAEAPQETIPTGADWKPEFEPEEPPAVPAVESSPPSAKSHPAPTFEDAGAALFRPVETPPMLLLEDQPAVEQEIYSTLFKSFPVVDAIPAGKYSPVGYAPKPESYMHIDRVVIDDRVYVIRSLRRNGNTINLNSYFANGDRLVVLRVKGDSMNKLVQDGEYVLVMRGLVPEEGDVVVATISGEETTATLKRYHRRGGVMILEPESTNPTHVPLEVPTEGFAIAGVALAALVHADR